MDECEQPIMIIKLSERSFKFYPKNMEAISSFLEHEREKLLQEDKDYCGAV